MAWRTIGFSIARPFMATTRSHLSTKARPGPASSSLSGDDDPATSSAGGNDTVIPWATVGFTATVIGAYVAYFYLVEQPRLPPDPEPLASEVVRLLPDGRKLMKDGSIQGLTPQCVVGFVAAPTFQGVRADMCFKKGAVGIGYYMDVPLHKR